MDIFGKHIIQIFPPLKSQKSRLYILLLNFKVNILFTYSYWESEDKLNSYRDSSTFGEVWPTIKPWFEEKPNAWTTQVVFDGINQI
jgi:hypothetical protein